MAIRVYLANNHDVVREGLKNILSKNNIFSVCGEYSGSNQELIVQIERSRPTLLFLDVDSFENVIIKNLNRLRVTCPKLFIISICYTYDDEFCKKLVSIDALSGILNIDFKYDEIMKAISTVLSNKKYIQDSILNIINYNDIDKKSDKYKINLLTKRELDVLIQVSNGLFNKEIALNLNISERTVKNHISSIFKKLEVSDRTQAAVFAIKNNIVTP